MVFTTGITVSVRGLYKGVLCMVSLNDIKISSIEKRRSGVLKSTSLI